MTQLKYESILLFTDGAYCTVCPITQEEGHNPDVVRNGFHIYWTIQKLHEWYDSLRKNPDGTLWISKKGIRL